MHRVNVGLNQNQVQEPLNTLDTFLLKGEHEDLNDILETVGKTL
jgi:hypothetical protein